MFPLQSGVNNLMPLAKDVIMDVMQYICTCAISFHNMKSDWLYNSSLESSKNA